ncbi:Macrolide export ATP-binding/permease protein MacB [Aquisphaera giovannonii]|uniref:Macrolide export ATP-binding/permease protein MacB n=1 Tax=Aquisphaera giovannonii TaxID=406548 RepID=A0A5B9WAF3_9BACT|nr:ABC transporter permease [Aquisphaera giovannonii]QEH37219.1 Macrolide export ATP-binding/permease protein MacB [Aquisphaera giovannonii]
MIVAANVANAVEQLWTHRLRSLLTVLGVVIAVTSTITVVGVIQGFTRYVSEFLQGLGTNAMWVWPERPAGEAGKRLGRIELDGRDVDAIELWCPAVRRASPLIRPPDALVQAGRDQAKVPLEGVSAEYHAIRNFAVDAGRPFSVVDIEQGHHVCILGREVLRKLNLDDGILGGAILVGQRRFRVVGILGEKGSFLGNSQDNVVLVPYTMALKMYPAFRRKMAVTAQAVTEKSVPEARAQIVNLLRRRHGLSANQPNDFNVLTQDEILETFNSLSLVATAVLAGIVGISLVVGGIGIMNVMLVSVTERTREIGLRKAVGARRRDILVQFLTESMCLSGLGGATGIGLGYGLCALASLHPSMVDVVVPPWAVGLGFGISAGTGVVFGLIPAVKAALLNPIDALRHE